MYLPSRSKLKLIGQIIIITIGIFVFKDAILAIFFSISHNIYSYRPRPLVQKLKKEKLALSLELERFKNLREENRRLRKALDIEHKEQIDLVYAKAWGFYPSSYRRVAFIDLGEIAGAKKGMLAIDDDGNLMGKILEVEAGYSRLILLNDPHFSLPVFIENKGTGLLKGTLGGTSKLLYVEPTQSIIEGDEVWADYIGLPVYVGKVVAVRIDKNDFFLDIDVSISANISSAKEVFLIKSID